MEKTVQCSFQRYEKKYLLSIEQLKALSQELPNFTKPDLYEKTTNCSVYYDTDNWELVRKSIEKPIYKEKLRVRSYGVPKNGQNVFLELKKKYKDVVYKRRITMPCELSEQYLLGDKTLSPNSQIAKEIEWFQKMHHAKPKVFIAYDRTSLVGLEDSNLRITFDRNIRWRDSDLDLRSGDFGYELLPDEIVLMEVKIPGTTPLWLVHLLSENRIRPASFSKYGTYYKDFVIGDKRKDIRTYA